MVILLDSVLLVNGRRITLARSLRHFRALRELWPFKIGVLIKISVTLPSSLLSTGIIMASLYALLDTGSYIFA